MSKLAEQKKLIDQLRVEASANPIKVSVACKDLMDYIQSKQESDVLASGFTKQNENPYKEKAGCLIS